MKASVIIPTYNRPHDLARILDSLSRQTLDSREFEVIVVDDGSTEDLTPALSVEYPFQLLSLRQTNEGATAARNYGATHGRGEFFIFADDDITFLPTTLRELVSSLAAHERAVAIASWTLPKAIHDRSVFARVTHHGEHQPSGFVDFTECVTCLLAVRRNDFAEIGGFCDPTGGWPNWDDLDFGYRASMLGFHFVGVPEARAEHWDHAAEDFDIAARRWMKACNSAVVLFQQYPDLLPSVPLFRDKVPIDWSEDSVSLVGRKLARTLASLRGPLYMLHSATRIMEVSYPNPSILSALYRWVMGGYMYRGYRQGLSSLPKRE